MSLEDIEMALLDVTRNEWTNPLISSSEMPKEGKSRIISEKWKPYRGKNRLIVVVELTASMKGEIGHRETWTLASGLGVLAMGDYKLRSIEKVQRGQ